MELRFSSHSSIVFKRLIIIRVVFDSFSLGTNLRLNQLRSDRCLVLDLNGMESDTA